MLDTDLDKETINKRGISIQSLLFGILIPSFFVIIMLAGMLISYDIYGILLEGFNNKLLAIGTTVSSFIDGDRLHEMSKVKQLRGLAFNSRKNLLYTNYYTDDQILVIDLQDRRTWHLPNRYGEYYLEDLAFSPDSNDIYGVDIETNNLIQIHANSGKAQVKGETGIDSSCFGLTYDTSRKMLICNSDDAFYSLDMNIGIATKLFSIELAGIRGLTYVASEDLLYATVTNTNMLYSINLKECLDNTKADCNMKLIERLREGEKKRLNDYGSTLLYQISNKDKENENFMLGVFGLAYNDVTKTFYSSTTLPIVYYQKESAKVLDLQYIESGEEKKQNKLYYEHMIKMFHIRNRMNITFLTSVILFDKGKVLSYVLDCDQRDTHSFVGYVDLEYESSDSFERVRDVWFKGDIFLSDVQYWEEWGLLKSAYVPIFNSNNDIVGIMIADIDVSIIKSKIQSALLGVVLIGFFVACITILMSFYISYTQVRPIEQLKFGVLKISAGNFGWKMHISGAKEFLDVVGDFNLLSDSFKKQIDKIHLANMDIEDFRKEDALMKEMKELANEGLLQYCLHDLDLQKYHSPTKEHELKVFTSGSIKLASFCLYWKTLDYSSTFVATQQVILLKSLLFHSFSNLDTPVLQDIIDSLKLFGKDIIDYFIIEEIVAEKIERFHFGTIGVNQFFLLSKNGIWSLKESALNNHMDIALEDGELLIISSREILESLMDGENIKEFIHLYNKNKISIFFDKNSIPYLDENTTIMVFREKREEEKEVINVSSKKSI